MSLLAALRFLASLRLIPASPPGQTTVLCRHHAQNSPLPRPSPGDGLPCERRCRRPAPACRDRSGIDLRHAAIAARTAVRPHRVVRDQGDARPRRRPEDRHGHRTADVAQPERRPGLRAPVPPLPERVPRRQVVVHEGVRRTAPRRRIRRRRLRQHRGHVDEDRSRRRPAAAARVHPPRRRQRERSYGRTRSARDAGRAGRDDRARD